jgi:hypothetical protein
VFRDGGVAFRILFALALVYSLSRNAETAETNRSPGQIALAREQFKLGVAAAKERRWEDAWRAFSRAYELTPRPVILLNLAGAEVQTGRLVAAAESYRRFLREAVEPEETRHRDNAEKLLLQLEQRIPRVEIGVEGLLPNDQIWIGEDSVSHAALGAALPVNPGTHILRVERGGRTVDQVELEVREGEILHGSRSRPMRPLVD